MSESESPVQLWREHLLTSVLRSLVILGGLAVVMAAYEDLTRGALRQVAASLLVYLVLLAVNFLRPLSYRVRALSLVLLVYMVGVMTLGASGVAGSGPSFLLAVPILAALFLGRREGVTSLIVILLTMLAVGGAFTAGVMEARPEELPNVFDMRSWVTQIAAFFLLGATLLFSLDGLLRRFADALTCERELVHEVDTHRQYLEQEIGERTTKLERHVHYMEAAATVARDAVSVLDVDELLARVVNMISEQLGFYHVGVFVLDPAGEWAMLQAASSEGGQRMLARRHRLRVGVEGIVGYVAATGEARVALDVGTDAVFFDNPDLPETRSEMALPLRAHGEVIGVLDVQSREAAAFTEDDAAMMQTLADLVAVAISNARLFQQVQESLAVERQMYRELTREAWRELVRVRSAFGFARGRRGIVAVDGPWRERMKESLRSGVPVVDGDAKALSLPLRVRGSIVGVVDARKPKGAAGWSEREIALMETLVEQVSLAMEGGRLYEDSQRRAAREQLLDELTIRMRETLDIETVLRTAVQEVRRALDLPEVVVRLVPRPIGTKGEARQSSQDGGV